MADLLYVGDYAKRKYQNKNSVQKYIQRNHDIFDNLTEKDDLGRTMLSEEAIMLLDKHFDRPNTSIVDTQMLDRVEELENKLEMAVKIIERQEKQIKALNDRDKLLLAVIERNTQALEQNNATQQLLLEQKPEKTDIEVDVPRVALSLRERLAVNKYMDTLKKQMQQLDKDSEDYKRKESIISELEVVKMLGKPVK